MALKYAVNDTDILDNCVSWWPLNESSDGTGAVTRYDAHGSNHLTDNNTTASAAGQWNRGADFEKSSSEHLSISDGSQSGLDITGDISISAWIKIESLPSSSLRFGIASKYLASGNQRSYAFTIESSDKLSMYVMQNGSTSDYFIESADAATVVTGDIGTWMHVAVTVDISTKTCTLYKNGSAIASSKAADVGTVTAIHNGTAEFALSLFNAADYFDGVMQDACIFNAVLSSDQISRLYNSGDGMTYGVDFDAASSHYESPISGTLDFNHTVSGTNRGLLVFCIDNISGGDITGVTYGGTALTKIDSTQNVASNLDVSMWYLDAPSTGTASVSVTHSSTGSWISAHALSYVGVKQSFTPTNYAYTEAINSTTVSDSLTVSKGSMMVAQARANSSGTTSAGSNTIQRAVIAAFSSSQCYDSITAQAAGTTTLNVSSGSSESLFALHSVELEVTAEAAAPSTFIPKVIFY